MKMCCCTCGSCMRSRHCNSFACRGGRGSVLGVVGVMVAAVTLTACGAVSESTGHNLPDNMRDVKYHWVRIDSPGNYPTSVRACHNGEGFYLSQDTGSSIEVVPNDPNC